MSQNRSISKYEFERRKNEMADISIVHLYTKYSRVFLIARLSLLINLALGLYIAANHYGWFHAIPVFNK